MIRAELKKQGCILLVTSADRFFAAMADDVAFPIFSEAEAWRFAIDDVVNLLTPTALAIDPTSNGNEKKNN